MITLRHISLAVRNPRLAANTLAELTDGEVKPFRPLEGAFACLWGGWEGQFVEFYPKGTVLISTKEGGEFAHDPKREIDGSIHLNCTTKKSAQEIIAIAKKRNHHYYFRKGNGGPLHEVWVDDELLFEIVTI